MRAGKEKKTYTSGAWYFLAPAVIVLFLVGIIPLLFALWNSLHEFILPKVKPQGSILGIGNFLTPPSSGSGTTWRC